MAAPTFVQASAGNISQTTGTSAFLTAGTAVTGNALLLQVVQDGTSAGEPVSIPGSSRIENLAGTDDAITKIGVFDIGSAVAALQHIYIGRVYTGAGVVSATITANNVGGDDCYARLYEFTNMNTGTALTDVIENSSAGNATNGAGTSVTVADTAVTTLGADRLALNCVGINDDLTGFAAFTGMTGGTWALSTAIFESATGTDATVALVEAAMASAGTINGGTDTITSDAWGVVGFALIGTTPAGPTPLARPLNTELQAVSRSSVY
jgi:hypothetical protein